MPKTNRPAVLVRGGITQTRTSRGVQLRPKSVDCPQCRAVPGESCQTPWGAPTGSMHVSRRRMAGRAYWAAREAAENMGE